MRPIKLEQTASMKMYPRTQSMVDDYQHERREYLDNRSRAIEDAIRKAKLYEQMAKRQK